MTKIFNLIELIPHNKPTLGKEEEEAVLRVIRSNQLSQEKEVELFISIPSDDGPRGPPRPTPIRKNSAI